MQKKSLKTTSRSRQKVFLMIDRFDSLKGIRKGKESVNPNKELDKLIHAYEAIMNKYSPGPLLFGASHLSGKGAKDKVYDEINSDLSAILKKGDFDKEELIQFINIKADSTDRWSREENLNGIITGNFLHFLTDWYRQDGKELNLHIDGKGKTFNCLFSYTKHADNIIIENLKSEALFNGAASHGGEIKSIQAINCTGDYMFSELGTRGKVGLLSLVNCSGDNMASDSIFYGGLNLFFASNLTGSNISMFLGDGGSCRVGILSNCPDYNYSSFFYREGDLILQEKQKIRYVGNREIKHSSQNHLYRMDYFVQNKLGIVLDPEKVTEHDLNSVIDTLRIKKEITRFSEISEYITFHQNFDPTKISKEIMDAYKALAAKGVFDE